jgi:hypothetical protein
MTAPVASGWSGCRVGLKPAGKRRLATEHTPSRHYQAGAALLMSRATASGACRDLSRYNFSIPFSAGRERGVFVNELPLASAPLIAIGLAHQRIFRIAIFEHDVDPLDRTDDSHVAVDRDLLFENLDFARFETAEDAVEHLPRRLNAFRGKSRDVEPKRVVRPMLRALRTGHGVSHLLDDGSESFLIV